MGQKCSIIMLTSLSSLTRDLFSYSSYSLSWVINYWISLFCSYAILSLLLIFCSCLRLCSTCSLSERFFSLILSISTIFWFSSYAKRRYCCFCSYNSCWASNNFLSWIRVYYLSLLPRTIFSFISFSFNASSYCFFRSFYFYWSIFWACCFSSLALFFSLSNYSAILFFSSLNLFFNYFSLFEGTLTLFSTTIPSGGNLPSNCFLSFSISSWYSRIIASFGSSLIFGLFLIRLACDAYRKVLTVYS